MILHSAWDYIFGTDELNGFPLRSSSTSSLSERGKPQPFLHYISKLVVCGLLSYGCPLQGTCREQSWNITSHEDLKILYFKVKHLHWNNFKDCLRNKTPCSLVFLKLRFCPLPTQLSSEPTLNERTACIRRRTASSTVAPPILERCDTYGKIKILSNTQYRWRREECC